ncbi:MAG: hypothetical protein ACRDP6_24815 [Actinoallomurus sp.]
MDAAPGRGLTARVRVGAVRLVSRERVGGANVWERAATVELGG